MWSVPPMKVPEMALDFGDITEFVPSMGRITTNLRESHPTTSHLVFRIHIVYLCDFSGMTRTLQTIEAFHRFSTNTHWTFGRKISPNPGKTPANRSFQVFIPAHEPPGESQRRPYLEGDRFALSTLDKVDTKNGFSVGEWWISSQSTVQ